IRHFLPPQTHELFQRKLRDRALQEMPNFIWCSHEAVFTSPAPSVSTSSVEAADRPSAQERPAGSPLPVGGGVCTPITPETVCIT
ncbi:hypothetical protein KUCAC02_037322, partial [Chaenocephalus aceratus]